MRAGFVAAACVLMLAACGQPTTQSADTTTTSAPVSAAPAPANSPDANFVTTAAMFENYAAQAADIASASAQSQAAKDLAAAEATAHRAALQQLAAAAQASGAPAPSDALDENHQAYLNMLRHPGAAGFDNTYAAQLVLMYLNASGQYDTYASTAADSQLKAWAQAQGDRLRQGVTSARGLARQTEPH